VDEFAKRWWYALPAWPPADFDYKKALAEKGLKLVDQNQVREPSKETAVYQIENFDGIFKDAANKVYDLRPQDTMPCLVNF
jgi:hypothetical protein